MRNLTGALLALPLLILASCGGKSAEVQAPEPQVFMLEHAALPAMRWDHRPEASQWTRQTLGVVMQGQGQALISMVPSDINTWCPAYAGNGALERASFWVGLLSAMAKHESTWNPAAVGGGGQWFGLVQISPATARGYGCGATSSEALKDGAANLSCAIRIIASTVPRDGVVAAGMRGVAADWGPFHNASKRADMAAWTTQQAYCN